MNLGYPLQWPAGRPRTAPGLRRAGRFGVREIGDYLRPISRDQALRRLRQELSIIGVIGDITVTTARELRRDGTPRQDRPDEPADPGVAVYFRLADEPHCLPCDSYNRLADNIAAIAAHIAATRAIERHGVASIAEMFAGFLALPSPTHERPWREVLELHRQPTVTARDLEAAYRRLARERHPDYQGGSDAMMAELNSARERARRELADA